MKTPALLIAAAALLIHSAALGADPAAPEVRLVVKKHLKDSEHEKGGKWGSRAKKTITLRVEVSNAGKTTLSGAEISGTALVKRARALNERVSREPLAPLKVPDLKPNDKTTLDLGEIDLHDLELRQRESEESLEEWQVVCTKDGKELGKAESSTRFATVDKEAVDAGGGKKGKEGGHKRKAG